MQKKYIEAAFAAKQSESAPELPRLLVVLVFMTFFFST